MAAFPNLLPTGDSMYPDMFLLSACLVTSLGLVCIYFEDDLPF
jgi:hypothetical protein